jgi:ABC-type phosphate transport system permease subunit
MLAPPRSNEKAGAFENIWGGVTILQWSKRFDATLGFIAAMAMHEYSRRLLTGQAIA